MLSPVLKKDVTNLAPFWAVGRQSRALATDNNMGFEEMIVPLPFPKVASGDVGFLSTKDLPNASVALVVMRNVKKINAGDLLTLPFFSKIDADSVASSFDGS